MIGHRHPGRQLRQAINSLPVDARRTLLGVLDDEALITGSYTDRRGRVCPMLALHRRGIRVDVVRFAHAWDAFCGARRPRLATHRELQILRALLEEGTPGALTAFESAGADVVSAATRG